MGHSAGLLFVNAVCTIELIGAGTLRVEIGKAPAQRFLIQKVPERICIVPMIPQSHLGGNSATERNFKTDMARKMFHVVPNGTNWQLKFEGRILGNYSLKTSAIAEGRRVAQANQPSELVIHNADGTIAERETYGNDPFPPRG